MSELIKKYDYTIDLLNNSIKNVKLNPLSTTDRLSLSLTINEKGYISWDIDKNALYIWDGIKWIVSSDIFINENLVPAKIGGYDAGLPATGPNGLNFTEFADKLLFPTLAPEFIFPSAYMFNSVGNNVVEVGTALQLILAISYNPGEIKGAIKTIPPLIWDKDLKQNNRAGAATNYFINGINISTTNYITINGYLAINGANTFSGYIDYSQGPQPINSVGANFSTPLPAGRSSTLSTTFYGAYRQYFGSVEQFPTNSSEVKALPENNLTTQNQFDSLVSTRRFVLAIPSSRNLEEVKTQNFETITRFFILSGVNLVSDASGTLVNYKVYNFISDRVANVIITIKLS